MDADAGREELVALDASIARLRMDLDAARAAYDRTAGLLTAAYARRRELVDSLARAAAPPPPPATPAAAPAPASAPAPVLVPAAPETSARGVQNVLFILGGLLLGSAAVVFTAVAWASFGVVGRAMILAVVTLLTLAVPLVALRRRLRATAETFAALGLFLILLDGYAAWAVNLAGVADRWSVLPYAGVVCVVLTVSSGLYAWATGLAGPRFVALVAAQPVPALLFAEGYPVDPLWTVVLTAMAGADLAAGVLARRDRVLSVLAWAFALLYSGWASLVAFVSVAMANSVPDAIRSAIGLAVVAVVIAVTGMATRVRAVRHIGVAVGVVLCAIGVFRIGMLAWPGYTLLVGGVVAAIVGAVALVLTDRGVWAGAVGCLAGVGIPAGVMAVTAAVYALPRAVPVWHAEVGIEPGLLDWQVPAVFALSATLAALLDRTFRAQILAIATVVVVLAVPLSFAGPWWLPSLVDGAAMVVLAWWATVDRPVGGWRIAGAVVVGLHGFAIALARPGTTALALVVLIGTGVGLAARCRGLTGTRLGFGAGGVAVAGMSMPLLDAALAEVVAPGVWWDLAAFGSVPVGLVAALGFLAVTAVAVSALRTPVRYQIAALGAVGAGVLAIGAAALLMYRGGVPLGIVFALILAVALASGLAAEQSGERREDVRTTLLIPVVLPLIGAVGAAVPAVGAALLGPWTWFGSIWQGRPAGVGLVPGDTIDGVPNEGVLGPEQAFVTLAILTALVAVTAGRTARDHPMWTTLRWAAAPLAATALVGCVAIGAPWPAVPAVTLAAGLGSALLLAFGPATAAPLPRAGFAAVSVLSGLAGCLPTRGSTAVALAAILLAAAAAGAAAPRVTARVTGWTVASGAVLGIAYTGAAMASIAPQWTAYWLLLAAVLPMGTSILVRRRTPGREEATALESAAHLGALLALLLTEGWLRHSAAVFVLWGIVTGLRALAAGESATGRRVRVAVAGVCQLVAYWLLLTVYGVTLIEAYTLPAALVALAVGWLAVRGNPALHSWTAYGPALLAGFVPSLGTMATVDGEPWRRLGIGVAGVVVVVIGSVRRLRAPVTVGGTALCLLAVHEIGQVWDLLPRWVPLAAAGALLVGLAITYERRRRDLARLRGVLARMR